MDSISRRTTCANPFGKHDVLKRDNLREITKSYIENHRSVRGLLRAGDRLCSLCRKEVLKKDKVCEDLSLPSTSGVGRTLEMAEGERIGESSSSSAASDTRASHESSPGKELATEDLGLIMSAVGETPIRTGQFCFSHPTTSAWFVLYLKCNVYLHQGSTHLHKCIFCSRVVTLMSTHTKVKDSTT